MISLVPIKGIFKCIFDNDRVPVYIDNPSHNSRDIYYAKYYDKGGGEMISWEKKIKIGRKRGKKKGGKSHLKRV